MNKVTIALFLFLPLVASAQTLQVFLPSLIFFLSDIVIPFLLGIAFLFFIINVIRFFVAGGSNEEGREKAKSLAIYGIAAFVFIIIFWGIINMLSYSIGLDGYVQPIPDYILGY